MPTTEATPTESYQILYLEKERLRARYMAGELPLDQVARRVNEIDRQRPAGSRWARIIIGAVVPLLFARSDR